MEIDPVCGMEVDPANPAGSYEHNGTTYYFCSRGCLEDFEEDPESYVGSPT
jgi:Cu+-exporting ATPase